MQITTISLAALSLLLPVSGLASEKEKKSRLSKAELNKLGVASEKMKTEVENCYTCSSSEQNSMFFLGRERQLEKIPQTLPSSFDSDDHKK